MENLPFTFVESKYLIEMLALYDENVRIKQFTMADAISDHVVAKYQASKAQLQLQLNDVETINLTVDLWTSPKGKAFLGITGHWVDANWHLRDVLIDIVEVRGLHSGGYIADYVVKSLRRDFGISEKLFCITADNASNNTTMAKAIEMLLPHFNAEVNMIILHNWAMETNELLPLLQFSAKSSWLCSPCVKYCCQTRNRSLRCQL